MGVLKEYITWKCNRCGIRKGKEEFRYRTRSNGLAYRLTICKKCGIEYSKKYWADRRVRQKEVRKGTYERTIKIPDQERRELVIKKLGNKCWCCGEKDLSFLVVDHVSGGGNKERKLLKNKYWGNIIKQGTPKDKYRVLCCNCNHSINIRGFCPHHPIKTLVKEAYNAGQSTAKRFSSIGI